MIVDGSRTGIVTKARVYGLEESICASKYPMATDVTKLNDDVTDTVRNLARAKRGSGHDCFLKGIVVQMDVKFTTKAWEQALRYHWFDIVSSQSTMHKLCEFNIKSQCIDYVDEDIIETMKVIVDEFKETNKMKDYLTAVYNNPVGFKHTARVTTNYMQLKTIYAQRKTHKLPEWREFCDWIETLPHSEFITAQSVMSKDDLNVLRRAMWEIIAKENIEVTNKNIDWLLDRALKNLESKIC